MPTSLELLSAHDYSPEDLQEIKCAIAMFQANGLPYDLDGAYELAHGGSRTYFAKWWRSKPIPYGFRLFEVYPVGKAGEYSSAIESRSIGFEAIPPTTPKGMRPIATSPLYCYWVVSLPDFITLENLKAQFAYQEPELALE